jgi:hypothetical protein
VFSFTSRPLYPRGKSLRYPPYKRLGGPQSRSGSRGEDKKVTGVVIIIIIIPYYNDDNIDDDDNNSNQ